MLPARIVEGLFAASGVDLARRGHVVTREDRRKVVALLKEWRMGAVGRIAMERGEVSAGGVSLDEVDPKLALIKGGGGALTREKIIAEISERFVCIVDRSKLVDVLGGFALPIEVIPMACAQVTRAIAQLGGEARLRDGFISDNGNPILDVHGLRISDPLAMETEINQWPGVVTVGLFARRRADIVLVADSHGIQTLEP
jgi:ribose 5-phosphate isomerase